MHTKITRKQGNAGENNVIVNATFLQVTAVRNRNQGGVRVVSAIIGLTKEMPFFESLPRMAERNIRFLSANR